MSHKTLLIRLFLLTGLLTACQPIATPAASGPLKVVATYSILGNLVQNIGGEKIALKVLIGPGGDAHTFEPSPQETVQIAEAALLFENGLEFETWLDDMYSASGSRAVRVVVSEGIEPHALVEEHHEEGEVGAEGEEHTDSEEHAHGEFDPHIWQSVANWNTAAKNVRDALVKADPVNTEIYTVNADKYIAELQALDTYIFERVKSLPETRRKLITSHDALGYFADRYGFEIAGMAIASISTEAADPSAAEIAALVDEIKAIGVPAIFAENIHNTELMEQIAKEAGVSLAPSLYSDALGEPGSEGDTYLKMMRHNVDVIINALSP